MRLFKKPIIVWNSYLARFLLGRDYLGITLFPFIFLAISKDDFIHYSLYSSDYVDLLAHESIHWEQLKEHGVLGFYWQYLKEYFQNRRRGFNHFEAYSLISFEILASGKEKTTPVPADWI